METAAVAGKVVVCGLGPSTALFGLAGLSHDFHTIGVNDIERYFAPDQLLLTDRIDTMPEEKASWIHATTAKVVWGTREIWLRDRPTIWRVDLHPIGDTEAITDAMLGSMKASSTELLSWIMSPFAAVMLAYKLGAKKIGLVGVDLTDGCNLSLYREETSRKFGEVRSIFARKGVELVNLSKQSQCLGSLPFEELDDF